MVRQRVEGGWCGVEEGENIAGGGKHLVGYYVAEKKLNQEEILNYLQEHLPEYMLPTVLVWLEKMPLTINGKLDRQALPNPELGSLEKDYIAPTTEEEAGICQIFAEVLNLPIDKVGITDDFFRLGGDSILSISASSKLRNIGFKCSVKDIFEYRTVERLAKHLSTNAHSTITAKTESGLLEGEFGLLPIQQWFFENVQNGLFRDYNHWNQSFMLRVPELDIDKLKHSINVLVNQHDMLRGCYKILDNNVVVQQYAITIQLPELLNLDIRQIRDKKDINKINTNKE